MTNKKTKKNPLATLTFGQLHREVQRREGRKAILMKKRKNLELRIQRLDAKLMNIDGHKKPGRKPKAD